MGVSLGSGGGRKAIADINVTPLVDVMLVLLVIFMVSIPLAVKKDQTLVEMNLPVTRENPTSVDLNNTEKLILRIDAQMIVRINEEVITDCSAAQAAAADPRAFAEACEPCFEEVQRKLGMNPRLQEEESLYLLADATIPYGFVVGVMNRIRLAGVTNVGMVTNPEFLGTGTGAEPPAE